MKTPEEMATDYANNNSGNCCANDFPGLREAWLAGYKAAMESTEWQMRALNNLGKLIDQPEE